MRLPVDRPVDQVKLSRHRTLGRWRSWLARLYDTQEVTGSSPVRPTSIRLASGSVCGFFSCRYRGRLKSCAPILVLPGVLDLPSRHPDRPPAVERSGSAAFHRSPEIYEHGPQLANSCSRSGNPIAPLPSRSHDVPVPGGPPQAPNNASRSGTSTAPLWGSA